MSVEIFMKYIEFGLQAQFAYKTNEKSLKKYAFISMF